MAKEQPTEAAVQEGYKKIAKILRRMGATKNPHTDDCTGWMVIGFYKDEHVWIHAFGMVSFRAAAKHMAMFGEQQMRRVSTVGHPAG